MKFLFTLNGFRLRRRYCKNWFSVSYIWLIPYYQHTSYTSFLYALKSPRMSGKNYFRLILVWDAPPKQHFSIKLKYRFNIVSENMDKG